MSAMPTPPWSTDESIPPQPLRIAPLPLATKMKSKASYSAVGKQQSFDPKPLSSAPSLKSIPRPIPRKQMSAPAASCQIPLINPPSESGLQRIVKDVQQATTTNPFLNGLVNFESIKTNFFSTTVPEASTTVAIEDERATKSAVPSKNPFIINSSSSTSSSCDNNVFDFNPTTIKSIMEEQTDDGYEGDNDNDDCDDPLKQLEARIQKLEASNKQRRRSGSQSPPRFSPKLLNKTSTSPSADSNSGHELNSNVNEKFVDSPLNDDSSMTRSFRKHIRNRSYSENEASDLGMLCEQEPLNEPIASSSSSTTSTTNPFQTNSKRPLLKTPSETYLEQYSMMKSNVITSGPIVLSVNNKTVQLCKHPSLSKIIQSSQTPSLFNDGNDSQQNLTTLKRTISSESISSDSSVIMSTLERNAPPITGNLCIALQYDK